LTLNEIKRYRARHWQHHLHLGNSEDTEISYRNIPGTRFVLESLFGIQLLGALHRWNGEIAQQSVTIRGQRWPVLLGVGLHLAVVLVAWWAGVWSSALTWTAAVVFALPFWLALRQLLEHRPLPAEIPAGADSELAATNRMFPSGFFSRFFGAAGFNRHLLHHWYPQASYSCFDDLEAFLMTTELGPRIDAARTEYLQTWRALVTATRTSDAA
jgi:fatty acid desaturase